MKWWLFAFLMVVILSMIGCTPKVDPIAYDCPDLHLPPDPKTSLNQLPPTATPDQVMKAWVATALAYRDWNNIVRKQVEHSR